MATEEAAEPKIVVDKYRSFLYDEADNTEWRYGGPPTYDVVNKLFEEGRTKEWAKGSLEETVQNAIKTWEMEVTHKTRLKDLKTINPEKFKLFVNEIYVDGTCEGDLPILCTLISFEFPVCHAAPFSSCARCTRREGLSGEETIRLGTYNALLKNTLPKEFQYYKADEETFESSHDVFRSAFPRGFAWEVLSVYSGPPEIAFKYRHWGFFEGPFKGHAPTGEMVQFTGLATLKVDESLRAEEVEVYYDPAELFGGLLKGPLMSESNHGGDTAKSSSATLGCPLSKESLNKINK
ncbi:Pathogen-related protein [Morella rubra]|uniref:Pathogen-related protein n=1 Tax=Morella rubra TaxID=262757 RepID=A0A6A1VU72_9ROSI|nr:Pathogen-related protein [Morella rubra]